MKCTAPTNVIFALLLAPLTILHAGETAGAAKTNILLIFADDLGWRDVGYNGGGFIETPNLDRLRMQGMSFPVAYACAGNCAPSRACLMSGQYTPRHGVYAVGDTNRGPQNLFRLAPIPNRQDLAPEQVTVAEALKAAGYVTGHFGKWHLGSERQGTGPRQQGFDFSLDVQRARSDQTDRSSGKQAARRRGAEDPKGMFTITKSACDFMERNRDRPFFAFVAHHAIHGPLEARATTLQKFTAKAATFPAPHPSPLYAAVTFDFDDCVGILLRHLTALGLDQNTLVVFTSDNGGTPQSINEPLRGAKGCYYEGGIREPFLVRWPGVVQPGTQCQVPVINLDLYPTFLAVAGVQFPPGKVLDGENLAPLFKGGVQLQRNAIFWYFPGYLNNPVPRGRDPVFRTRPVSVIRKGAWKLHLYHEEWVLDGGRSALATNRAVELYHLDQDLGEHHDVAQTNPEKRDELLGDLLAWMQSTNAKFPGIKTSDHPLDPARKMQVAD